MDVDEEETEDTLSAILENDPRVTIEDSDDEEVATAEEALLDVVDAYAKGDVAEEEEAEEEDVVAEKKPRSAF